VPLGSCGFAPTSSGMHRPGAQGPPGPGHPGKHSPGSSSLVPGVFYWCKIVQSVGRWCPVSRQLRMGCRLGCIPAHHRNEGRVGELLSWQRSRAGHRRCET
jgi:hypothetical protein